MDTLQHVGRLGMHWGKGRKGKQMTFNNKNKHVYYTANPHQVYKHMDQYSTKQIQKSIERMKLQRDLRNLDNDQRQRGAKYAQSFLAYGTAAATAYGFYKSPMGQKIKEAIVKNAGKLRRVASTAESLA